MLDVAREEIIAIGKTVTPQESAAWMMASLYGREYVPPEYEAALREAMPKMCNIGWLVYTQLMAEGLKYEPKKKSPPRKKPAKKKQATKKPRTKGR